MLETLDSVAWDRIPTAYDKGAQLPKLLKKLTSRSESARDKASFDLREEVAHQGQIEPDAARAVAPFLVELIDSPKTQDRDRLLSLLGDLACGGSSINSLSGPVSAPFEPIATGLIDSHAPLWSTLLAEQDEKIVAATTLVVAFAGDPAPWCAPLVAVSAAPTALGRASALLALDVLARRGVSVPVTPFHAALTDGDTLVQSAAIIGLARLESSALTDADYDRAVSLAHLPPVEHLPWADGYLAYWVALATAEAAAAHGKTDVLWRLIDARSGALPGPAELALVLAKWGLRPYEGPRLRRAEELDPAERALLVELCKRSLVGSEIEELARRAGLFDTASALARLLGLDELGPLDRIVDGEPLWRLFNDQLNGRIGFEALATAVDRASSRDEVLDLLYDAATGYPIALEWPIPSEPARPERAAEGVRTVAGLLASRYPPDTLAAEIRQVRPGPAGGKYSTSRHRVRQWVEALLLALARSPRAALIASDPVLHKQFQAAADTTAKRAVAVARFALEAMPAELRWRLLSAVPFFQLWSSVDQRLSYRGGWDLLVLAPADAGSDWVLDALEKCEPEAIPVDRLAVAETTFGAIWAEKVALRRHRLAPHQLQALQRAHELSQLQEI